MDPAENMQGIDFQNVDANPFPEPQTQAREPEPTTLAEILSEPAQDSAEAVQEPIPFTGEWQGPPESAAADIGTVTTGPELAQLTGPPDPFLERYGFDAEQAQEIFAQLPEAIQPQTPDELIAALDSAGVTSVEDARRFRDHAIATYGREQREREKEERFAAIEERLTSMPGSPLESRLANIEKLLSERKEQERHQEYVHQEAERVAGAHSAALGQLVLLARARGIEPPDPADIERFYQTTGVVRLEPNYAARLAWTELVGPELFGPKPDPRRQTIRVPAGQELPRPSHPIPAGPTGGQRSALSELIGDV